DPSLFHTTNVIVHAVSALFVWLILRRLTGQNWVASAGAILFALHPVQVEAVVWVSGLKDVLAGGVVLIAVWQYLRVIDTPAGSRVRVARYLATMLWLVLGLLSKPSAVVTPIFLFVIDWLLVGRPIAKVAR